jgi:hypothetical protein
MTTQRRFLVHESVVEAPLDEEVVLLRVDTGVYYGLAGLGHVIWEYLRDGKDEASIVEAVLEEYEAAPDEVTRDVRELLDALFTAGLISAVQA